MQALPAGGASGHPCATRHGPPPRSPATRPGGHRRGERTGRHRDRRPGRGSGHDHRRARGRWRQDPAAAGVARVPLTADGTGAGRTARGRRRHHPSAGAAAADLERHRPVLGRRGPGGSGLLGAARDLAGAVSPTASGRCTRRATGRSWRSGRSRCCSARLARPWTIRRANGSVAASGARRPQRIMAALGALHLRGIAVDWPAFHRAEQVRRTPLPTYAWRGEPYWFRVPDQPRAIAPETGEPSPVSAGGCVARCPRTRSNRPISPAS